MSATQNQPVYVPVPVEAAAEIGKRYDKDIVVICAWDFAHGMLHTTTWGAAPLDKHHAAVAGEICAKALRADFAARTLFEDYRLRIAQQLLNALCGFAELEGARHEEDCPSDDTCECRWKPWNDRINTAIREAIDTLGLEPVPCPELPR